MGDCWFLAALAALAEEPDLIRRLFASSKANTHGVYETWRVKWASAMRVRGISISHHFPLKSDFLQVHHCPSLLKFTRIGPETFWKGRSPMIFQKAWTCAKMCQNVPKCAKEIKCFKNGRPTSIILDDFLPCSPNTGLPCYAHVDVEGASFQKRGR